MRIMVVDDETPIKDYIAACIRGLGGDYVLTASVSRSTLALERLQHEQIDVVLTDITMPRMNGLELLSQIKLQWPEVEVVMLTCHDDFDYVRTAMQSGAADYILKSEITPELLRRLLERLGKNREKVSRQGDKLHAEQYLCRVLEDEKVDILPEEELQLYGLPRNGGCFALMFKYDKAVLDELAHHSANWVGWQLLFSYHNHRIALLAGTRTTNSEREQREQMIALYNGLQALTDSRIGLSELHRGMSSAKRALLEAMTDMDGAFYRSPGATLIPPRTEPEENLQELFIMRNNAVVSIHAHNTNELQRQMDTIFAFARAQCVSVPRLRRLLIFVVNTVPELALHPVVQQTEQAINDAEHLDELESALNTFVSSLNEGTQQYSANIQQAVDYIRAHFCENLSLQDAAQSVFLNNEYFSRRFKKEVGVNFSEYLLKLRLDEADHLLRQTDLRVGEIAERVGIGNVSYFSMVYKKQFGSTPNESRRKPH